LMNAVPKLGRANKGKAGRLAEIPGRVPDLTMPFAGCVFAPRCSRAQDVCSHIDPALEAKADDHLVACHFADTGEHPYHV